MLRLVKMIGLILMLIAQVSLAETGFCKAVNGYWQCNDELDFYYKFLDDFVPLGGSEIEVYPTPWVSGFDSHGIYQLRMSKEGKILAAFISPERGQYDSKINSLYKKNEGKYSYALTDEVRLYVWGFSEKNCQGIADLYTYIMGQEVKELLNAPDRKENASSNEEVAVKSGEPLFTVLIKGSSASAEMLADAQLPLGKWALHLEKTLRSCSAKIEPTILTKSQMGD